MLNIFQSCDLVMHGGEVMVWSLITTHIVLASQPARLTGIYEIWLWIIMPAPASRSHIHSPASQPDCWVGFLKWNLYCPNNSYELLLDRAQNMTQLDPADTAPRTDTSTRPLSVLFSLGESKKEKCHSQNNISCWWRRPDNKRSERSNKSWMQPQEKTNDHGRLLLRTNNGTNKHDSLYLSNVVVLYVEN